MFSKNKLMKLILTIFIVFFTIVSNAQTINLYGGDSSSEFDVAYKIENGFVYHGGTGFNTLIKYTISDNKVFIGRSTSSFSCLYTIDGSKVYRGDSRFSSDVIYTIQDNKVYRGDFPSLPNCIYTYEDNKLYMGDSNFPTDILFTISSNSIISLAILAAIIGPY